MFCECDGERPEFFSETEVRARKDHRCVECHSRILPGETYVRHSGKWEGEVQTFCWCQNCVAVQAFVSAHVPCFCWTYSALHEDALYVARALAREAPGFYFGTARRIFKARKGRLIP